MNPMELNTGTDHFKTVVGFLLGTVVGTILSYNWDSSKGFTDKFEAAEKRLDVSTQGAEKRLGEPKP